jgi:hypothetical protein
MQRWISQRRAAMRSGVEVIGGRRVPCPDCGGKGSVLDLDLPSLS